MTLFRRHWRMRWIYAGAAVGLALTPVAWLVLLLVHPKGARSCLRT